MEEYGAVGYTTFHSTLNLVEASSGEYETKLNGGREGGIVTRESCLLSTNGLAESV